MNGIAIAGLSVAMSMDALAATVARAASSRAVTLAAALRSGLIFGAIQTVTPVIGWALGRASADYLTSWAPLLSLLVLCGVGGVMLIGAMGRRDEWAQPPASLSVSRTIITGLATSLDAMAVGASLAFADIRVSTMALSFGLATFVMATGGTLFGAFIGRQIGKPAEIAGGLALLAIGVYGYAWR